ncbi:MAG: DUF4258 domain-containing protein [Thermodesulfobacteriota bacterium]|jgi:hypothetical protein
MKILWTRHAEDRQKEWEKKLGIKKDEVERVLRNPEQIVPGDKEVLVAQSKAYGGLLRVPFAAIGEDRKVLTIYWTSKVERYWR